MGTMRMARAMRFISAGFMARVFDSIWEILAMIWGWVSEYNEVYGRRFCSRSGYKVSY